VGSELKGLVTIYMVIMAALSDTGAI
jgi:hypothetical protein